MRKPEFFIGIFLGNLLYVTLIVGGGIWFWADHMYNVGMDVDFWPVFAVAVLLIIATASTLSWVTWKITKGKL